MKNINIRKRNLGSGSHLLGALLIMAGLFVLISPAFLKSDSPMEKVLAVGIVTLIIGFLIVSSYSGTLIDFTQKRFKEYLSIGGYQFGEWMVLPEIMKIKVTSTSYLSSNTPNGISPTISGKVIDFTLRLYSNAQKPVFMFKYSNGDKAIKQARRLAKDLDADLVLNIPE
jgi:hypothetical protein